MKISKPKNSGFPFFAILIPMEESRLRILCITNLCSRISFPTKRFPRSHLFLQTSREGQIQPMLPFQKVPVDRSKVSGVAPTINP